MIESWPYSVGNKDWLDTGVQISINTASEDMEKGTKLEELQVKSLVSKIIEDDALAWKELNEKCAATKTISNLTYKLKAMQPGLTLNMTCEDPMPAVRSLLMTPYFQDLPYTAKELEYMLGKMTPGERLVISSDTEKCQLFCFLAMMNQPAFKCVIDRGARQFMLEIRKMDRYF